MTLTSGDLGELGDLATALGMVDGAGDFRADWFTKPGDYLSAVLADDTQRDALLSFVDEALGGATRATDASGLVWLPVVTVAHPALTVSLVVDERPADCTVLGVGAELTTTGPASTTKVHVPVFRAAKAGHSVPSPIVLGSAAGVITVDTEITVDANTPPPGEPHLRAVGLSLAVPTGGTADPVFGLSLRGLQLPGTTAPTDVSLSFDDLSELDDAVLGLILGLVQAQANGLPAGEPLARVAALLGLRTDGAVPPLPFDRFATEGAGALAGWFDDVFATASSAWLGHLAGLLGGTLAADGVVRLDLGIARLGLSVRVRPGTGDHVTLTPTLSAEVDGATDVLLRAEAELFTVDLGSGGATALPSLSVQARFGHAGALLVDVADPVVVQLETIRVGIGLDVLRRPVFLLAADHVTVGATFHETLDLSSPDALAEVAGTVLGNVVTELLGKLGPAGATVAVLLGFTPPPGHPTVPMVDLGLLLRDPVAAVAGYWKTLLDKHSDAVTAVLTAVRDLLADADRVADAVTGSGTEIDPWLVPLAGPVDLVAWTANGSLLALGLATAFRVETLGGGCSRVDTSVRVTLAEVDLAAVHASFLTGVAAALTVQASGGKPARLGGDFFAITADHVGLAGSWTPVGGLDVAFVAPSLMIEVDGAPGFPVPLPAFGPNGFTFPPEGWDAVESFLPVLARGTMPPWIAALFTALGWGLPPDPQRPHLRLADLVADPVAALRGWLNAVRLAADPGLFQVAFTVLTRLVATSGGTSSLLLTGTGTPEDPYLLPVADTAAAPSLAVWALPAGPCGPVSAAPEVLRQWLPGMPALTADQLAAGLRAEAAYGADIAALLSGRPDPADGITAVLARLTGTDGRIAPPPADPPGVTVHSVPDATFDVLPVDLDALGATAPVVVHVAVVGAGASPAVPWPTPPTGHAIDLTGAALAPETFTAPSAATGDWYVTLASRSDAKLTTGDPDGVAGQAARLHRVLDAFASLGTDITVVAYGAAGHAARRAAEEQAAITTLVTAGTPYGPIAFTVLDTDPAGDTLRLLHRLLPPTDDAEPDDPDLALGRAMVDGLIALTPLGDPAAELRLPAPPPGAPRAGLTVHAVFGTVTDAAAARGVTAIVAAGLSLRAQQRAADAGPGAQEIRFGLRLPLPEPAPTGTPPAIRVTGYAQLDLAGLRLGSGAELVSTSRSVRLHAELRSGQGWLVGGPDPARAPGTPVAQELRWLEANLVLPLGGTDPGTAELVLHEPRVFGIERERWTVRPVGTVVAGEIVTPALPEVRVLLSGAVSRLAAATEPVATAFDAVLQAMGIIGATGGSVPDAVDHLLHDPAAHVSRVLAATGTRQALAAGLRSLLAATGTGDQVVFTAGPATVTADLAARTIAVDLAATTDTAVAISGHAEADATGHASFAITFGAGEFRVTVGAAPLAVAVTWERPGASAPDLITLWPAPDAGALGTALARLVPAEAGRTFLELLRDLDPTAKVIIDAALDALGLLGPLRTDGLRAVVLPSALITDPGAWFRHVLGGFSPPKAIAVLDALKPLLGVAGGPGQWQVTPGITISATGTAGGLTLGFGFDTGAFAGTRSLNAGGTAGLTFTATGSPRPAIDVYCGLPAATPGRSAIHLSVDSVAGGVRLFLRPDTGADVSLVPPGPGLGGLVTQAVTKALPLLLNAVAEQTGNDVPGMAGHLVAATGDALGLRTGPDTARTFDADALQRFGADPAGALVAALPSLTAQALTALATAFGPALPGGATASVAGTALVVHIGQTTVTWTPNPFSVTVHGTITGIPVVETVDFTVTLDGTGLGALVVQVGPAAIDAGGVELRPVVTAAVGTAPAGGRRIETGLALDADTSLLVRWPLGGDVTLVFHDGGVDHTDPEDVALGLLRAVLDLVATFVIGTDAVSDLLGRHIGSTDVRGVLKDVVLSADGLHLDDDLFDPDRLLGRLQQLALNIAGAHPSVTVGGIEIGVTRTGDLVGVSLGLTGRVTLVPGDITLALEVDSTWIDPAPAAPGIVLNLITAPTGQPISFTPGLTVNGVGLRITRSSGPLLDSVVVIESIALHLYGEVGGAGPASGGAQLQLAGLAVAVGGAQGGNPVAQGIMGDSGKGSNALAPKFSPALAVQKHGSGPVMVSLRAGDGAGPWWLAIQHGFGPLYVEQVGFGVTVEQDKIQQISVLFDGRVSIFGLTAAVDDLSLTYLVSAGASLFDPASWAVDLAGLAISSDLGGVLLQGGLRKFGSGDDVQYVGMLFARFGVYGLSVFGGYGQSGPPGDRFASFFAFGAINGPIGGPPAFFVTGLGGGIGINRGLIIPTDLSQFGSYPLIQALDPGAKPSADPMADLERVGSTFPVARDEFWFAAGVSFTSFALVDGVVVVSIAVGDGLEVALLGLARMALPRPQFALVSIELGLVARFSTKEAVLWVQAQLTDNSWLLYPEIRLTGGFAFVTWFGGPNAGEFVLTMGGYHPSFHRDGYPEVPRLGFQWRVSSALSIKGESYLALTSEAVMAGGRLEAAATFGPAWASLVLGADAIVYFDPFFLSVTVYARIAAGITIDVWIGEITISISIGAQVTLEGPEFHGSATFSVGPADLTIEFGDTNAPKPLPIGWSDFVTKYLEEAAPGIARAVTAIPGRGAVPPGAGSGGATDTGTADGSAEHPFEVICEFEITVTTTVPTRTFVIGGAAVDAMPSKQLGIAPMNIADAAGRLTVRLDNVTPFDGVPPGTDHLAQLLHAIRGGGAFPAGVWGPPQNTDDRKVPEGEVITAAEGATFTAAAAITAGSVPIVYNQVKVRTRLPLPFVNSRAARTQVLVDAGHLAAIVPLVTTLDQVLDVSARWLGNAGYGRTTLAAFVGDRAAPPLLGTLGEGLTGAEVEAQPSYPDTHVPDPVDTTVHPPRAIAVFTAALDTPERAALRTTVTDDKAPRVAAPTMDQVRAEADLAMPGQLALVAPKAGTDQFTVLSRGVTPLTRQARTGAEASAVRGSAADGVARLRTLTNSLAGNGNIAAPAPVTVHAGEITVLRLPNAIRDVALEGNRPVLTVQGCPARTLVLGHGGDLLVDTTAADTKVELPRGAERIVVAALGDQADDPARLTGLAGWHAGMALGYTGWSAALAPGAIVRCQGRVARRGLARVRAGWVQAAELVAGTGMVETRFAEPVTVVVVAIDDPAAVGAVDVAGGGQGGRGLAIGLSGAQRVRGRDGTEQPPTTVVDGGRGYAVYAVEPVQGKAVVVTVASEDGWHLVGVLGGRGSVGEVAARLAGAGLGDLVRPFAPGDGGSAQLGWEKE